MWKRFIQGDEEVFMANTRRFAEITGVEVTVDSENWEEVRPKAAVAANVGRRPDIIIATNETISSMRSQLLGCQRPRRVSRAEVRRPV